MGAPQFLIYGLVDPRTKLVRYVGCSSKGLVRPRAHAHPKTLAKDRTHKANWIRSLLEEGYAYEIAVLASSTEEALKADEVWWIAYGRASAWPLTNLTDGGDGTLGWSPSPEYRAALSARFKGRVFTPEHLEKIAEAHRGQKRSPEARENMRRAQTGKKHSPEQIEKRKASAAATHAAARPAIRINLCPDLRTLPRVKPVPPISEETRALMRAAKLGRSLTLEHAAKIAESNRGKKRTPEQRARLSEAHKARFADRTHCPQGHELTPENLRPPRPGRTGRECKTCWYESSRKSDAKKRALKTGDL
jgi:hypothetical protein